MPYICLYVSYLDSLRDLSDQARGKLLLAMLQYAATGESPRLTGDARILWPMIRSQMDRDAEKYRDKCEINRINGAKGGRPSKNPTVFSDTEGLSGKPKKAKEKEKEKEKENNNDNNNDNTNEKEKKNGAYFGGETRRKTRHFLDDIDLDELYREKPYSDPYGIPGHLPDEGGRYGSLGPL